MDSSTVLSDNLTFLLSLIVDFDLSVEVLLVQMNVWFQR